MCSLHASFIIFFTHILVRAQMCNYTCAYFSRYFLGFVITHISFKIPSRAQYLLFFSRNYYVSAFVRKVKMLGNINYSGSGGNEGSHSLGAAAFIHCTNRFCLNLILDSVFITGIFLSEAVDIYSESSYRSTMEEICLPSYNKIGERVVSTC